MTAILSLHSILYTLHSALPTLLSLLNNVGHPPRSAVVWSIEDHESGRVDNIHSCKISSTAGAYRIKPGENPVPGYEISVCAVIEHDVPCSAAGYVGPWSVQE